MQAKPLHLRAFASQVGNFKQAFGSQSHLNSRQKHGDIYLAPHETVNYLASGLQALTFHIRHASYAQDKTDTVMN